MKFSTMLARSARTLAVAALAVPVFAQDPAGGEITVRAEGRKPVVLEGPMLWTHFGISGPAALDASRHWQRAKLEGAAVKVTAKLLPGHDLAALEAKGEGEEMGGESESLLRFYRMPLDGLAALEAKLVDLARTQPRTSLRNSLSTLLPGKLGDAVLDRLKVRGDTTMANLSKEDRRRLAQALIEWPLPVVGGRGYTFAEVTAGGVPLSEVDPSTLESRRCPGLYFSGEILDVDGRLGGFNFQWAWSSAWVVGSALARDRAPA